MNDMAAQDIEDIYELSPLQQGMLFHTLFDTASSLYFEQESYPVPGPIDIPVLAQAWREVVRRHPILRSSFHWEGLEKPVQVVHRHVELRVDTQDWRDIPQEQHEERLERYLSSDRAKGFELAKAPLMRLALLRRADELVQFVLSFHHILLDGWSYRLIADEAWEHYEAYLQSLRPTVRPGRPYGDFIAWLQRQDPGKAEVFWRGVLRGFSAPTGLGVDRVIPADNMALDDQGEQSLLLPRRTSAALRSLGRRNRLTLNTLVQGVWAIVLSRYSGDRDVVFGTVVSGRSAPLDGIETMVGLFINTLPLRTQVPPSALLLPWMQNLQAQQLQAREYEYSPPVEIQRCSEIPPGTPLFESLVVFENYPVSDYVQDDDTQAGFRSFERSNYPLTLMVMPDARLQLKILYSKLRFDDATIARMLGHVQAVIDGVVTDPDRRLMDLPLLSQRETHQLLAEWNDTEKAYPDQTDLISIFEAQAARAPEALALQRDGAALSFGQLNRRANQFAWHLRALGVRPETRVGICTDRSFDMVAGMLAILKAGGAYVPLDPAAPADRLAYLAQDAGLDVVLCQRRSRGSLPHSRAHLVVIDDPDVADSEDDGNLGTEVTPDTLAYVIYTSGSSGQPKGVGVEHRQLLNRLHWMWDAYPFGQHEVGCQKTALTFVDSLWELLGPLLQGFPTVIVPEDIARDPVALVHVLGEARVSRIWLVPSMLSTLLATHLDLGAQLPALTFWVASGEELPAGTFRQFQRCHPGAVLFNLYGTSEVWDATWYDPRQDGSAGSHVPIGRPIANTQAYILDPDLQPVPAGVAGELHIGGQGLARGYLGRPGLTAERFVPHPFSSDPGARLYKTGDLARHRIDGSIEFLGRIDRQVKLRGFRIELGEIETVLCAHTAVREAAVLLREDDPGNPRLVAYVVLRAQEQSAEEVSGLQLRQYLRRTLPEYMVPSAFVNLATFPLTATGKLDRRALPAPDTDRLALGNAYVAPRTSVENQVARIFGEVLGTQTVGAHDNFFELGGHSLLAIRAVARMREAFDVEIPLRAIFETPTVAGLAQWPDAAHGRGAADGTPGIVPLSPAAHAATLLPEGKLRLAGTSPARNQEGMGSGGL
jgi:amino acid adenylation domain-containing protein